MVIVSIVRRVGSRDRVFFIRPEHTPNNSAFATRFTDEEEAYRWLNSQCDIPDFAEIRIRPARDARPHQKAT